MVLPSENAKQSYTVIYDSGNLTSSMWSAAATNYWRVIKTLSNEEKTNIVNHVNSARGQFDKLYGLFTLTTQSGKRTFLCPMFVDTDDKIITPVASMSALTAILVQYTFSPSDSNLYIDLTDESVADYKQYTWRFKLIERN